MVERGSAPKLRHSSHVMKAPSFFSQANKLVWKLVILTGVDKRWNSNGIGEGVHRPMGPTKNLRLAGY